MSDTTATANEKERVNLRLDAQAREHLLRLAGGERQMGDYLSQLINTVADAQVPLFESAMLDTGSLRQIVDASPPPDEALPSVAKRKRGDHGAIRFGLVLWRDGRPEGLKFPYDSQALGWGSATVNGSILSQCLSALSADGWQVVGHHGDSILLQRPKPLAQSLN